MEPLQQKKRERKIKIKTTVNIKNNKKKSLILNC